MRSRSVSFGPKLFCYNGQAHQEGGDCGEVWHALRSVAEEDGEEDRDQSARQIHLLLLRQDQDEEEGCRDLALWLLHEDRSWRRLDVQHHVSRHGQICHQASEGAEGPVDCVFTSPCGSLEHPIIINLSLEPDLCFCLLS